MRVHTLEDRVIAAVDQLDLGLIGGETGALARVGGELQRRVLHRVVARGPRLHHAAHQRRRGHTCRERNATEHHRGAGKLEGV